MIPSTLNPSRAMRTPTGWHHGAHASTLTRTPPLLQSPMCHAGHATPLSLSSRTTISSTTIHAHVRHVTCSAGLHAVALGWLKPMPCSPAAHAHAHVLHKPVPDSMHHVSPISSRVAGPCIRPHALTTPMQSAASSAARSSSAWAVHASAARVTSTQEAGPSESVTSHSQTQAQPVGLPQCPPGNEIHIWWTFTDQVGAVTHVIGTACAVTHVTGTACAVTLYWNNMCCDM